MKQIKLAIIQFSPTLGDLQSTIQTLTPLLNKAKDADLIVLPELANTGYNFDSKEHAFSLSESISNSFYLNFLQKICEMYNCKIATGFSEKEGAKLYNSAILLDKNGTIGIYRKLHLFMNEKSIFEPGNLGLPVFEVDGIKIGMLVCFDWMFPETWRKLALNDVDLIVHPSNLVLPYAQSVIPSYALVNRIFIAMANRIGTEKDLSFTGQSIIVDPTGKILSRAGSTEEVLLVNIDVTQARNKMITPLNDAFTDRRTDVYN